MSRRKPPIPPEHKILSRSAFARRWGGNSVSPAAINETVTVIGENVDLDRPVQPGDRLSLLNASAVPHEILTMSLITLDANVTYYRFRTPDSRAEFYDAMGKSAARAFRRKPFSAMNGTMESPFGWREGRMHTGVDWKAPRGTQIVAPANGTVGRVEWRENGGWVSINHANGYETTYSCLSAIALAQRPGTVFTQGEAIGTIGWNGMIGPILHYELMVNGRFVDPLRVRLPSARRLEGEILSDFRRERERLDNLATDARTHNLFTLK
jgi:murein DD-endopeptidase MepM/ murein hydrolase activator NlpD